MELTPPPHRCPHCQALVVDRRSPACTTCRQALPAEWVMTSAQAVKTNAIDQQARAMHRREMQDLTGPWTLRDVSPP